MKLDKVKKMTEESISERKKLDEAVARRKQFEEFVGARDHVIAKSWSWLKKQMDDPNTPHKLKTFIALKIAQRTIPQEHIVTEDRQIVYKSNVPDRNMVALCSNAEKFLENEVPRVIDVNEDSVNQTLRHFRGNEISAIIHSDEPEYTLNEKV